MQSPTSPARRELFAQTCGLGALELRGGDFEVGIWVNGVPLVFDGDECSGSICRFTILFDGAPRPEVDAQIARDALQGFPTTKSLVESVQPLLDLMPNGDYELWLEDFSTRHFQFVEWESHTEFPLGNHIGRKAGIYADSPGIYFTQPYHSLNQDIILEYMEAIEGGSRPAAIVWAAQQQKTAFVLDGHHKIAAYWHLKQTPLALFIQSRTIAEVPFETARELVEPFGENSYLRCKKPRGWFGRNSPPVVF